MVGCVCMIRSYTGHHKHTQHWLDVIPIILNVKRECVYFALSLVPIASEERRGRDRDHDGTAATTSMVAASGELTIKLCVFCEIHFINKTAFYQNGSLVSANMTVL